MGVADKRRLEICTEYWPNWQDEQWIGDSTSNKGWVIVPRTIDLVATLAKRLKPKKSSDPSRIYLNLWCRVFSQGVVEVRDERELMYACGYSPSRGRRTWREGLAALEKLGLIIVVKPWGDDAIGFICLRHPDLAVQRLDEKGLVPHEWKAAYEARMKEIGASHWQPSTDVETDSKAAPVRSGKGKQTQARSTRPVSVA